ncbi:hypothetical protein PLANPX_3025 [Lacipirellula parvula]|uniref:Uncharacterized protein n=1 Tax=Lacipirellula parvula TaxID=2650471 RepID=A0A5K7XGP5_9BACT|nr:hypothetical protein PLANPX_3025 [Lacipirellula parvula]
MSLAAADTAKSLASRVRLHNGEVGAAFQGPLTERLAQEVDGEINRKTESSSSPYGRH